MIQFLECSRKISEIFTLCIFIAALIVHQIAKQHGQLWFRVTVVLFLLMMAAITRFYRSKSKDLSIGQRVITKEISDADIAHGICSIVLNGFVLGLVWLFYNLEYINANIELLRVLSFIFMVLTFLSGAYLAYFNRTYKQNLRKFSYLKTLRLLLVGFMLCVPILEFFISKQLFILFFPYFFIFTLGFFREAFSECTSGKYIFYLLLSIFSILYLSYDIVCRFELVTILS